MCLCCTKASGRAEGAVSSTWCPQCYGHGIPAVLMDQKAAKISFKKHLNVLREHFEQPRWIGDDEKKRLVAPVLDCFQLELQQSLSSSQWPTMLCL